jgi:hypothetical protein
MSIAKMGSKNTPLMEYLTYKILTNIFETERVKENKRVESELFSERKKQPKTIVTITHMDSREMIEIMPTGRGSDPISIAR